MAKRPKKEKDIKIGKRLQQLRKDAGISNAQVADGIGYKCGNTIDCWEAGLRTVGNKGLRRLAVFFGVNLQWLVSGEGEKESGVLKTDSCAELMAATEANVYMKKTIERYIKSVEENLKALPRLIDLLGEIGKLSEDKSNGI